MFAVLFMMLYLTGCTAGVASPVISPIAIIAILLVTIIQKVKIFGPFLLLGTAFSFMIAIFVLLGEPKSSVDIAIKLGLISISGLGLGFVTRIKNPHPFWLTIIRAVTEPWAIGFIFGYLVLGIVPWILFPLYIVHISPYLNEVTPFITIGFVLFYFLGGCLVVMIPFSLTRVLLDLSTLLMFYTKNDQGKYNHYPGVTNNFGYIFLICCLCGLGSIVGCVYVLFFLVFVTVGG